MKRPLIVVSIGLSVGIAAGGSGAPSPVLEVAAGVAAALCALALPAARRSASVTAGCAFFSCLLSGLSVGALTAPRDARFPPGIVDRETLIEGRVETPPEMALGRARLPVRAERVWVAGAQRLARFGLALTVRDGANVAAREGDTVRFSCVPRLPGTPGSPGAPDRATRLSRVGASLSCSIAHGDGIVVVRRESSGSPAAAIRALRGRIDASLARDVTGPHGAILRALTTGNMGDIAQETRDRFALSGTAHILSISGLHTTIVAHLAYMLALALFICVPGLAHRLNVRRAAALAALVFVWCYAVFAGAAPPVVRAAIMTSSFLLAIIIGRDPDLPSALALAAAAILLAQPAALFDISFDLSFASMIAMAIIVPRLLPETGADPLAPYRSFRPGRWLRAFFAATVAATIGTAPIVAAYFNQVSLVAPLSNLVAVPLSTYLIVPLGLCACVLYGIWPAAGSTVAAAGGRLCEALDWMASGFAALPGSHVFVSTPTLAEMILFLGAVLVIVHAPRRRSAWAAAALAIAAMIGVWAFDRRTERHPGELEVSFVDVGQGDCIFIGFPGGGTMLVDGGGASDGRFDTGRAIVAPYLYHRRLKRLDHVVLTHAHADHMGGLATVVDRFRPRRFWTTAAVLSDPAAAPLLERARNAGSEVTALDASQGPRMIEGVKLEIPNPPAGAAGLSPNDSSVVLRLTYRGTSFLLTGDIQEVGEAAILGTGRDLRADVLKVAHQGSRTSTHDAFLDAVRPSFAVVMVGGHNPFGFPHDEVVARLEARGTRIVRTDRDGTVTFVTGSGPVSPSCYRSACR
ncbi:MAG: DNA internalization-related competence protein ComEC/Rec2 [Deltaproteobacteria bacterium]|nr:DNA internalization-related competence protein ComEC/Rec2 [Deltaproteobacteria bacterium]